MNKKNKKKLLCLTATCLVLIGYTSKKKYNPNYIIIDNPDGPFASYSDGFVYIGNKEYLLNLTNITENDVLILDDREALDPNLEIYNSYLITDKEKEMKYLK